MDITVSDLEIMNQAVNYRRWLYNQIAAGVGQRIIEIGPGIGNYTEFLLDRALVTCVEVHPEAAQYLRDKFAAHPNVEVIVEDIANPAILAYAGRYDTSICLNVLEHVEDDGRALAHMHGLLAPGGRCLLIVPALQFLYGSVDRSLLHFRRYSRASLASAVEQAGFAIEKLHYMNFIGMFGWFWNNRVTRIREENRGQILFYDRYLAPILSRAEKILPPPIGLSLVCIARKT